MLRIKLSRVANRKIGELFGRSADANKHCYDKKYVYNETSLILVSSNHTSTSKGQPARFFSSAAFNSRNYFAKKNGDCKPKENQKYTENFDSKLKALEDYSPDDISYLLGVARTSAIFIKEITKLQFELASATKSTGFWEFLSNYRMRYEEFEQSESDLRKIPNNLSDKEFKSRILALFPNEKSPDEVLLSKKHERAMVLILNDVKSCDFSKLIKLRELLNNNRSEYIKFSRSCQRIYSIVSVTIRGNVMDAIYFKSDDVLEYVKFLDTDVRRAVQLFYESDKTDK